MGATGRPGATEDEAPPRRPRWLLVLLALFVAMSAAGMLIAGWLILRGYVFKPPVAATGPVAEGYTLVQASDCMRCHLAERKAVAQGLREQSEARKAGSRETGTTYADVDTALAVQWLNSADSQHMIHGHTHRPADHVLVTEPSGRSLQRTVLSDWDGAATPARAEVLRLGLSGQLRRANPAD